MDPLPTIAALRREFASGALRPSQAVESCLTRIAARESDLRAWVEFDAAAVGRARDAAAAADRALTSGAPCGPLHGVPLAVKDIIDVEGLPTRCGARHPELYRVGRPDAEVIARLRQAGAVLLGKTVTTDWASFDPPPTRNPWDASRTPGGSSSGSAAAVAAEMCPAALGSQTGGSLTRPATYCGVATLKPTWGRVSVRGVAPLAFHLDHVGPIARRVEDLAAVYDAIAGHDPLDPLSVDQPADPALAAVAWGLAADAPAPRLGWIADYFPDETADELRPVIDEARRRLLDAGAEVCDLRLPAEFARVHAAHRTIMAVEAALAHRAEFPARRGDFGPRFASLMDEGLAAQVLSYAAALEHQRAWRWAVGRLLDEAGVDVLLCAATDTPAPPAETTGNPKFQSPWSHAGLPTVAIPCGLTAGPPRLPGGVQFVGRAWDEPRLLAVAAWAERALDFRAQPPA